LPDSRLVDPGSTLIYVGAHGPTCLSYFQNQITQPCPGYFDYLSWSGRGPILWAGRLENVPYRIWQNAQLLYAGRLLKIKKIWSWVDNIIGKKKHFWQKITSKETQMLHIILFLMMITKIFISKWWRHYYVTWLYPSMSWPVFDDVASTKPKTGALPVIHNF